MADRLSEINNQSECGVKHSPGHKCCGHHEHHHHHTEEHHAHHADGCNCGNHNHAGVQSQNLSEEEQQVISAIKHTGCIPVVRFVMKSSKSSHFESTALSAVYISSLEDDLEDVKSRAKILNTLENKGLLSIDYDIPITNYNYDEYTNSNIYKDFEKMMEESTDKEGFIFDIADMDKGSVVLV